MGLFLINTVYFTALILVIIRVSCFFFIVPVFFPKGTPNMVKVAFCVIISYILMAGINYQAAASINSMSVFAVDCVNEALTGLSLGFITDLCFMSARYAGSLMDMQVGFSMMTMYDPSSASNTTLIERLLYYFSLTLFLIVDGHHMLIKALIESFNVINIGKFILMQESVTVIIKAFIEFFTIGLKIAVPIILILILADITMGLVARTVPQLNVMILGLPVKILVGMMCIAVSLPIFLRIIESSFNELPQIFKNFYKTVPLLLIFASEDKTEEATPHKLSEAKKKGQVARSKEITLALTLLASTLILSLLGNYASESLGSNFIYFLGNSLTAAIDEGKIMNIFVTAAIRIAFIVLPFALPIMVMGILGNFLQTGFIFTNEPLKPDLKKINPINGFKRMFSSRTAVELLKDIAIVTVVGYIGYKYVKDNIIQIMNYSYMDPQAVLAGFGKLVAGIFSKVTLIMMVIAITDFIYEKLKFRKEMRMTKQEIKEEFKQEEGDPQIKSKIRQKQREMAARRMMQAVPKATVVVTNPTHIAVALSYNEGKNEAPVVVAKGADYIAMKIKEKAAEYNIPVIENKPLARFLYENVEIDTEIPQKMYQAVAEILAVVYKLKKRR